MQQEPVAAQSVFRSMAAFVIVYALSHELLNVAE